VLVLDRLGRGRDASSSMGAVDNADLRQMVNRTFVR